MAVCAMLVRLRQSRQLVRTTPPCTRAPPKAAAAAAAAASAGERPPKRARGSDGLSGSSE
eukprot:scaffold80708_cov75-Phaeocystis_antarctica.AAC.3